MKYSSIQTPEIIKLLSTGQLVEMFITTGQLVDAGHPNPYMYDLRGWIMDELEIRDPDAFNAWLDSDDNEDAGLRKYINC